MFIFFMKENVWMDYALTEDVKKVVFSPAFFNLTRTISREEIGRAHV